MTESCPNPETSRRGIRFGWFALGIFVLAIIVRGLHLWQLSNAPFFELLMGDSQAYDTRAQEIAAGDWIGEGVFFMPPLYSYLLALLYKIFGHSIGLVRIFQSIAGAFSCVLLADAGRRFFSKSAGIAAGLLMAFYGPAIFFDSIVHNPAMAFFFLSMVLWIFSMIIEKPGRVLLWAGLGLAMGCTILLRENALIFVIGILFWLLLHYWRLGRQYLVFGIIFLVGLAAILLPVAIRNYVVGGQFHLTTSNFGRNFYIGNNAQADGLYKSVRYGRGNIKYELEDDTRLAEQAMGRKLSPKEVSRYWSGLATDYITAHPFDWIKLKVKVFTMLLNSIELADTEDQYTYAKWSMPLRLTGFLCHFGVIAPLGLFGIAVTQAKRKKLWLLYLLLAMYTGGAVLFYVFARYRYPIVPFLVLFAAAGLVELPRFVRKSSVRQILTYIAAITSVAVFCNWPMISKDVQLATMHNALGSALKSQGRVNEATGYFRQALEYAPTFANAWYNLANILVSQGDVDGAIEHYRKALQFEPRYIGAHINIGTTLAKQGKLDEAIMRFREVLQVEPDHPKAHNNLGTALLTQGKFDEAIIHFRKVLEADPNHLNARNYYGEALLEKGLVDEAVAQFNEALRIDPQSLGARSNIAKLFLMQGRIEEAVANLNELLRLHPKHLTTINNLAWVLATTANAKVYNPAKAVKLAQRACDLTGYRYPQLMHTLAVAYAAEGRFDQAINVAEKAIELARSAGEEGLALEIQRRLQLYRAGKPYPRR